MFTVLRQRPAALAAKTSVDFMWQYGIKGAAHRNNWRKLLRCAAPLIRLFGRISTDVLAANAAGRFIRSFTAG
jgi:hypothetical protein